MRKLFYMGLESYQSRYTYQLTDWSVYAFENLGIDYEIVPGSQIDDSQTIVTGQVLDAHGRSYFSMTQMANLVLLMKQGKVTSEDVIFFEDMFQPGIESIPYILDQIDPKYRPKIAVRCLAQSIDPDDFVNSTGMTPWMSHYEKMVDKFADYILASNEEMVMHMKVAGWTGKIYNISGLSFGKDEVLSRVNNDLIPFEKRGNNVVFAARWDDEKQPNFYLDLIEKWYEINPNSTVKFHLLSGAKFKTNDVDLLIRTRNLIEVGDLVLQENLTKDQYYAFLNNSRVMFNCALQDWTSNTVSEADTLGCNVLFPAYRSFPEIFANDHERLYIPWSLDDACSKLESLLYNPHRNIGKISDWTNGTIERIVKIVSGEGEEWNRSNKNYRKFLSEKKY